MCWICIYEAWNLCNIRFYYCNDDCCIGVAVDFPVRKIISFCRKVFFLTIISFIRNKLLVPEVEKTKRTDVEMDDLTEENVRLTNDNKNVEIVASK